MTIFDAFPLRSGLKLGVTGVKVGIKALLASGAKLALRDGLTVAGREAITIGSRSLLQTGVRGLAARSGIQLSQWLCLPGRILSRFPGGRAFSIKYGLTCFEAGTQVVVGVNADGSLITKSIENIEIGDVVLARDEHDAGDDVEFRPITEVFKRTSDHIRVLTLRDSAGNEQVIRTTDEHPFYVAGLGWLNAGALQAGMSLSELDGSNDSVIVSSLREAHPEGVTVYNLSVAGDRTFFVADESGNAVWVHNFYGKSQLHHFVHKALGSRVPYGHKLLTPLVKLIHVRVHRAFGAFLVRQGIPRGMQTSADLIRLFPNKLDRIGLLVDFYGSFRKGKYLQSFLNELGPTLVRGLMR